MGAIATSDTRGLLQAGDNPALKQLAKDGELVVALTAVLNASLDIAENFPQSRTELATALGTKAVALSSTAQVMSDSKNLEMGNFAVSQALKSIGLLKAIGYSPVKASAFITLTIAEKIVSAAGLGQVDKCRMAVATLATSTGLGIIGCWGTLGLGCAMAAVSIAADAFNVHAQCTARRPSGD